MTDALPASARLAALPRKVQTALRELLSIGQVNADVLNTVLDATELAGSPDKALGFAVGYLHLQSQGIPVKDVIRMARAQGRRIRLDWSARRWQDEHDRLARAETLKRLSEQNVHYSVSDFAEQLPGRLRGYVIRTSRRLGMEGLRQRHCVASYHTQIQAGYCALATVFIERKRWTVQLGRTGKPESPLRIVCARSRFNERPGREMYEAIHRALGIPVDRARAADEVLGEAQPRTYMDNLRRILPVLREHGVREVTVSFDGCGDSGSIDDVHYGNTPIEPDALIVEIEVAESVFDGGRWITRRVFERTDLSTAIEKLTDDYLDETHVNWYNGDGGYGELIIDVEHGTVALEVNVRHTESTTEYWRTLEIASGEELDV